MRGGWPATEKDDIIFVPRARRAGLGERLSPLIFQCTPTIFPFNLLPIWLLPRELLI